MKAYYLSLKDDTPSAGYWDYAILDFLLADCEKVECRTITADETAVVVLPARHHKDLVRQLNRELAKINKVVLFLMGDEEHDFPVEKIKHNDIEIWIQNPQMGRHDSYHKLGTGYTPHTKVLELEPEYDWYFAGQITHERRRLMQSVLKGKTGGEFYGTKSFTAGNKPDDYNQQMASAKVAPAPSGPQTPDTFRLFEAMELGVMPIAEEETPKEKMTGFWHWLFGEVAPFPILQNYDQLDGYIADCVANYPAWNNRMRAWWYDYKYRLRERIRQQLGIIPAKITVIIQTSPIASHPDISIIKETIDSVLHHLPEAEVIITADGVRAEQEDRRDDYEEYLRRLLNHYGDRIRLYRFEQHQHQVGMLREVIDKINSPLLLYLEHDTPLVTDYEIDFNKLGEQVERGQADFIRFHFEAAIPEPHKGLMLGEPRDNLLKTIQWSQRPHLSSLAFYRRILATCFSEEAKCFVEDKMHGVVQEAYYSDGMLGWQQYKLMIYHPKGNIKRSYHTDGRAGKAKYDDSQTF